jgi:hypothetical protein
MMGVPGAIARIKTEVSIGRRKYRCAARLKGYENLLKEGFQIVDMLNDLETCNDVESARRKGQPFAIV